MRGASWTAKGRRLIAVKRPKIARRESVGSSAEPAHLQNLIELENNMAENRVSRVVTRHGLEREFRINRHTWK